MSVYSPQVSKSLPRFISPRLFPLFLCLELEASFKRVDLAEKTNLCLNHSQLLRFSIFTYDLPILHFHFISIFSFLSLLSLANTLNGMNEQWVGKKLWSFPIHFFSHERFSFLCGSSDGAMVKRLVGVSFCTLVMRLHLCPRLSLPHTQIRTGKLCPLLMLLRLMKCWATNEFWWALVTQACSRVSLFCQCNSWQTGPRYHQPCQMLRDKLPVSGPSSWQGYQEGYQSGTRSLLHPW